MLKKQNVRVLKLRELAKCKVSRENDDGGDGDDHTGKMKDSNVLINSGQNHIQCREKKIQLIFERDTIQLYMKKNIWIMNPNYLFCA